LNNKLIGRNFLNKNTLNVFGSERVLEEMELAIKILLREIARNFRGFYLISCAPQKERD
jgi:hypothetical protein